MHVDPRSSLRPIQRNARLESFSIQASAATRKGTRKKNEDAFAVDESSGIAVLADGLGGQAAGEVASKLAVDTVFGGLCLARRSLSLTDGDFDSIAHVLAGIVSLANMQIYERSIQEPDKQGMGTTLDAVITIGKEAYLAHVGDGRVYRVSPLLEKRIIQITEDHSLAATLVETEALSPQEAEAYENTLLRSVGTEAEPRIDLHRVSLNPGDYLVLCTDGVWQQFRDSRVLLAVVRRHGVSAAEKLVQDAIERGGQDNATAIVLQYS